MPVCYVTISEEVEKLDKDQTVFIRKTVASEMNSFFRELDETHISLKFIYSKREYMLGDLEIDILAQFDFHRYFLRDRKAKNISDKISTLLGLNCATWINLNFVGYSRVNKEGEIFFSD